jgi:nucleotide-binding universal stress UspA family protein
MGIRRILARVDGTDGDRDVLGAALEAATSLNAHVDVVHVRFDSRDLPLITGYGIVDDLSVLADSLQRTADHGSKRARGHFEEWLKREKVALRQSPPEGLGTSAAWVELEEREAKAVDRLGRLVDLLIIAQPNEANALAPQTALESAVFETRRPVLMVPPLDRSEKNLFQRPVIAWNGSPEASLAVAMALPFLQKANGVVGIFAADDVKQSGSADDLATYLGWHGIAAEQISSGGMEDSVGADLLWEADAHGAGLLIMGAYTHGRVRQLLLGGVTTHVLRHARIPVLLAH